LGPLGRDRLQPNSVYGKLLRVSSSEISRKRRSHASHRSVTLKQLAEKLGLSPATVSVVLNGSIVAGTISQETKDLIFATARKLNYRPNFFARSLRTQRSLTIGVIVPEVSEGYATAVLSGIEDHLLRAGYFYFVASHRHREDLIDEYPKLFLDRAVDGIIAVDTHWHHRLRVPVVTVSGRNEAPGVVNVVLDHELAARLALEHLAQLGHHQIAFIKGQAFSSDTEIRWSAIQKAAAALGISVSPKLTVQLEGDEATPHLGYKVTTTLIKSRRPFTAIFAFNDISAIGAIRSLRESGLRVPEDVSVVGFDDIPSAAYQNPALTTIRQPLRNMGSIAAEAVLRHIRHASSRPTTKQITVVPELIVRDTTCAPRSKES
jgi:DNA-binding LacI/PurR family transcriptional regulator